MAYLRTLLPNKSGAAWKQGTEMLGGQRATDGKSNVLTTVFPQPKAARGLPPPGTTPSAATMAPKGGDTGGDSRPSARVHNSTPRIPMRATSSHKLDILPNLYPWPQPAMSITPEQRAFKHLRANPGKHPLRFDHFEPADCSTLCTLKIVLGILAMLCLVSTRSRIGAFVRLSVSWCSKRTGYLPIRGGGAGSKIPVWLSLLQKWREQQEVAPIGDRASPAQDPMGPTVMHRLTTCRAVERLGMSLTGPSLEYPQQGTWVAPSTRTSVPGKDMFTCESSCASMILHAGPNGHDSHQPNSTGHPNHSCVEGPSCLHEPNCHEHFWPAPITKKGPMPATNRDPQGKTYQVCQPTNQVDTALYMCKRQTYACTQWGGTLGDNQPLGHTPPPPSHIAVQGPYLEQQVARYCQIHAINALAGYRLYDPLDVMHRAEQTHQHIVATTGHPLGIADRHFTWQLLHTRGELLHQHHPWTT